MIVTDTIQDRVEDFFEDKGCCVEAWDTDKEAEDILNQGTCCSGCNLVVQVLVFQKQVEKSIFVYV